MTATASSIPPLRKQVALKHQEPFVLDPNLISSYYVLYQLLKSRKVEQLELLALVPPRIQAWPLRVRHEGQVKLQSPVGEIQAEQYSVQAGDLHVELYAEKGQLIGVRSDSGQLAYRSDRLPQGFQVAQVPQKSEESPPTGMREIEVQFESAGLKLAGTLALPQGHQKPVPAVLFIAGSGPVDRNENAPGFKTDIFKQIAWRLAEQGIASLRYDKRGVGKSEGIFKNASMNDLVADARAALGFLKHRPEIDPDLVYVLGHSEGGILGPILATEEPLAGLIILAGPARPLDQVILWQLEGRLRSLGAKGAALQKKLDEQRQFFKFVKQSHGEWGDYTFKEAKRFMPWLKDEAQWQSLQSFALSWFRQHFKHDPLATIRKVHVPVLIIQGEKDIQVPPQDAKVLAKALKGAGNANVTVRLLPDLNHLMRHQPEDAYSGLSHLDKPVDGRVLQAIGEWLKEQLLVGKAVAFVRLLRQGKFDQAYERFDQQMQSVMPIEKLRSAWETILAQVGEFRVIRSTKLTLEGGFYSVYVTCQFAQAPLNVKVVFGKDEKDEPVMGLWFQPVK